MKRQILTPKNLKNAPWHFWQRKAQTHIALNIIYNYDKWGGIWENEIEILQDGIWVWKRALKYKDRGYHKNHRKHRDDAKRLIKRLTNR